MPILQSIKPQCCELIASGKKTIEVRKTRPKCELPVKVYIYETKTGYVSRSKENDILVPIKYRGKCIGEYVCDEIETFSPSRSPYETDSTITKASCLSIVELIRYSNADKPLYAWHISDLKIYDKPKELSEFTIPCKEYFDSEIRSCNGCKYLSNKAENFCDECLCDGLKPLTRPPQSFCYVEEVS